MILGDTFLRNAYALFNYGNWTRADDGAPYMQLLSVRPLSLSLCCAMPVAADMAL